MHWTAVSYGPIRKHVQIDSRLARFLGLGVEGMNITRDFAAIFHQGVGKARVVYMKSYTRWLSKTQRLLDLPPSTCEIAVGVENFVQAESLA